MAADVLALDDDQWLYGGDTEKPPLLPIPDQSKLIEAVNENGRDAFLDDLEDMEHDSSVAALVESTPVFDSQVPVKLGSLDEGVGTAPEEVKPDVDSEDDEDDDVQITIGEIKTDMYNRQQSYPRLPATPATPTGTVARKVDLEAVPQVNGQTIYEVDLDNTDKPWRLPGADISDYFNYGFTEESWKLYCDKQRKMKSETGTLQKIAVQSNRVMTTTENTILPTVTLPTLPMGLPMLPPPVMSTPSMPMQAPTTSAAEEKTPEATTAEGDDSDGRRTPNLSQESTAAPPTLPLKTPLIPPPLHPMAGGLPPPPFGFHPPGFPPQDQGLAAAMAAAAVFGGIRPPDPGNSMPPPPSHPQGPGFPPIPPPGLGPMPDGLPHFPGMPFPHGDHGPMGFDERVLPPMPPEMMAHGVPFWDAGGGQAVPDFLRPRSRSRSTSSHSRSRSRSSSYDRHKRRDKRHRRRSRSRSRSGERDRERYRSSRHHRDHHRGDRYERDKDRDKDRERDRERRSRREHGRSRHERSSRRHRSSSRDKDEERSSRKEKQSERSKRELSEQENSPKNRSRSTTPT